jgi:CRP-like cAMP-binding protein
LDSSLPPVSQPAAAGHCACATEQELAQALTPAGTAVVLAAGEKLFAAGDAARGVFLITGGNARAWLPAAGGEPLVSRSAGPGAVLGIHAALCSSRHQFEVEAEAPLEALLVETADFHGVLRDRPLLCMKVVQMLCDELNTLGQRHEHMQSCTNHACSLHSACTRPVSAGGN